MPRAADGTYSLPAGNPVTTLTVISSTWANSTLSDISTALTGSLARNGDGAMLAGLQLADGAVGAPGLTWGAETTSGLYRAGAGDFRWSIAAADKLIITATAFTFNINPTIQGTDPILKFNETDAAPNNRRWSFETRGEALLCRVYNDAEGASANWLVVDRTLNVIDSIAFSGLLMSLSADVNASLDYIIDNDNNGTTNAARTSISSGDTNAAWFVTGSGRTSVVITNGPTGAQTVFRTLGAAPILFGTSNTLRLFIDESNGFLTLTGPQPEWVQDEDDAAANERSWIIRGSAGIWALSTATDAAPTTAVSNAIAIDRNGTTVTTFSATASTSITLDAPLLAAPGIHNGTAPTGTTERIASGTYTPVATNVANLAASSPGIAQWIRVGNVVTVTGTMTAQATSAATLVSFRMTLPIASNLATATQLGGAGAVNASTVPFLAVFIQGDTVNNAVNMIYFPESTSNRGLSYTYSYLVL